MELPGPEPAAAQNKDCLPLIPELGWTNDSVLSNATYAKVSCGWWLPGTLLSSLPLSLALLPEMRVPPALTPRLRPHGTEQQDGRSLGPYPVGHYVSPGPLPELDMTCSSVLFSVACSCAWFSLIEPSNICLETCQDREREGPNP